MMLEGLVVRMSNLHAYGVVYVTFDRLSED